MDWKLYLTKVKAWLLAFAANMWEDCLKDYLKNQIDQLIKRGTELVIEYHDSEDYKAKKEAILNFVFDRIQLPVILKPFKGLIKSILSNSVEKQIEKALDKLKEK